MKSIQLFILFFSIGIATSSCSISNKIQGTWVVENVKVGNDTMTPMGKWVKFQKDHTQTSGNGWVQHTIGTWKYHDKTDQLEFLQTNGFKDEFGPFDVEIGKGKMVWKREEEGQPVKVSLRKTDLIPQSPADKLLGVWDLESVTENGNDISKNYDPEQKRYLFLRWDKIFTIQHSPKGRIMGLYKTHGHRQDIQMVYYGETPKIENWQYEVTENQLILSASIDDEKLRKVYKRIDFFPT